MPLQKLVGNVYSVLIEIILWIIPIAGAVAGYFVTEYYYVLYSENRVLWVFAGIAAGLLIDVILFGPIIILLNIRAFLKNIAGYR